VVELYVKERNVAPNTIGTLALAASPYLLLTWSGSVVEFAIRPSTSVFSNATAGIPFLLELDQLRPTFSILPADPAPEGGAPSFAADLSVEFTFPRLNEVAPNGSVVQSAVLEGQWQAGATATNATQKFVLAVVGLFNDTATKVTATISLFDRPGSALFANITLALRPELAKLSLAITGWPWLSPDNHLEVAIAVHPPFASATALNTTANMTTFELRGQHDGRVDATIRVLDAAEVISNTTTTIVTTSSFINTAASELVLRFPYFGTATLIHDPGTRIPILILRHDDELMQWRRRLWAFPQGQEGLDGRRRSDVGDRRGGGDPCGGCRGSGSGGSGGAGSVDAQEEDARRSRLGQLQLD
jgi:hypothetical protein